jgi:N-acetylglucosamine-6-phosphate deacetylase
MATATPARVMGLSRHGRIDAGSRADVVALDQSLRVAAVWQAGRRIV